MYIHRIKPIADGASALLGLCLLAPLLLCLTILLAVTTRRNPFFCQRRIGYRGRLFWLVKFRTMSDARDRTGQLLPDAQRITSLGRWLRRTSMDELPQLANVLLGQMSLIGPRPLLKEYAPVLANHNRHTVRPGLTGWAQIHGRNHLTWPEKLALDEWYVTNVSFRLDCLILWRTLPVLLDTSPPAHPLNALIGLGRATDRAFTLDLQKADLSDNRTV